MSQLRKFEFYLLRYVPDAVKGEFVNVGVVLMEGGESGNGFADIRMTDDWRRLRCLDPEADVEMLQAMEGEIRERLNSQRVDCSRGGAALTQREWIVRLLEESCSNVLQVTDAKGVFAEEPRSELARLVETYCQSRARARREFGGTVAIQRRMKEEFTRAGVWPLMRHRISVAKYTKMGDPLKIDCGYRPNGVVRMFHAVSLMNNPEMAKVLAFSFPELRKGMEREEGIKAELTAIVEDDVDRADEAIDFAMTTLARHDITIARARELPQMAERARVELRL